MASSNGDAAPAPQVTDDAGSSASQALVKVQEPSSQNVTKTEDEGDLFRSALDNLLQISESILDNSKLKKRDKIVKEFRRYRIVVKSREVKDYFDSIKEVRNLITIRWRYGLKLHDLILENDFQFSWEDEDADDVSATFYFSKIYHLAQEYRDKTKTHLTDEKKAYPDLLLLYFSRMMHYIEADERLQDTIRYLESTIKISEHTVNGMPASIADMMNRFAKGQGNNFFNKMSTVGQKLMNSGVADEVRAGNIKGALKKVADPDVKNEINDTLAPLLDPLLQRTATLFEKRGVTVVPGTDNSQINVKKLLDKISTIADGDHSEEFEKLEKINPMEFVNTIMNNDGDIDDTFGKIADKLESIIPSESAPPQPPEGYKLADDFDLYDKAFLKRSFNKFGEKAVDPRFVSIETGKKDYPIQLE